MQIDLLLALGVTSSTAATDADYLMFSASSRRAKGSGCQLEQRVVSAFRVRGDQLFAQSGVREIRGKDGVNEVVDNHCCWVSTRGLQSRFFGSEEKS